MPHLIYGPVIIPLHLAIRTAKSVHVYLEAQSKIVPLRENNLGVRRESEDEGPHFHSGDKAFALS